MTKNKTIIAMMLSIITLIVLAGSAFAAVDVSYNTYEASFNANGNFIATTNPVDNVNVIGFVCADASCSTVSGSLWNGQVLSTGSDNQITLQYPTQLQSQYGYAIFYYKPGYVSWVQNPTWAGTGTVPGVESKYLTKVESCRAPISSFAVINDVYPNQPIMVDISTSLDANTASPFMWNNIVGYHPSQLASYNEAEVTVTLTISNSAGQVVSTQQQVVTLDPSETQRVMFDYTPTVIDGYTARVSTDVTDAKCLSSDTQFSQKSFSVISQNPTNQCYTLLNNLNVQPTNQTVGQPVTISFDKISNAYNAQGQLSTLGTAANIVVTQNGQTVSTQQLQIGANQNTVAPQTASTQFTPQSAGYYTVSVNGFSQNCPYTTSTADTVSQSFYAYSATPINNTNNTNTTNQAPVWLPIPGMTLQQNAPLPSILNLNLYVIDPDSNQLTFSIISNSDYSVAQCSIYLNGNIACTATSNGAVGTTTVVVGANDGQTISTSSFVVTVLAVVPPNNSCLGPNGVTIAHTASATYFQTASVPFGQTCVSEARTCSNGVLSGSFASATCTVLPASSCVDPNGITLANGASNTYFQSASVPFGNVCTSEVRSCNNGVLSGTFASATCIVLPPAPSCTGPDGAVIASGSSATYYQFASVTSGNVCTAEVRSCNSGALSGSFQFNSCIVGPNTPPVWTTEPQLTIRRNSGFGSIDLSQFVFDPEVPPQILTFSPAPGEDISQLANSIWGCSLSPSGILACWTNHGQDGRAVVNVSVSDGINSVISEVTIVVGIDKTPSREKADNGLMIMQFHVPEYRADEIANGRVPISVGLKNEGRRLKDVLVTATILETGARTTMDTFNIGSETQNVQLYLPLDTKLNPGVYTVRLTISDKETGMNRIEHRDLVIYN